MYKILLLKDNISTEMYHNDDEYCMHQTDTACAWLVRHSRGGGGGCKLYQPILPPRRPGHPVLGGSQLLAGDIESNPGPKLTLKKPLHTRNQPHTLTKYTNSSVQPPQSSPASLPQPTHPLLHQPPDSLPTLLT